MAVSTPTKAVSLTRHEPAPPAEKTRAQLVSLTVTREDFLRFAFEAKGRDAIIAIGPSDPTAWDVVSLWVRFGGSGSVEWKSAPLWQSENRGIRVSDVLLRIRYAQELLSGGNEGVQVNVTLAPTRFFDVKPLD